jgi:hypothetical protein
MNERFSDDIPFQVFKPGQHLASDIQEDRDSSEYKDGYLARENDQERDIGKPLQWLLGWDAANNAFPSLVTEATSQEAAMPDQEECSKQIVGNMGLYVVC